VILSLVIIHYPKQYLWTTWTTWTGSKSVKKNIIFLDTNGSITYLRNITKKYKKTNIFLFDFNVVHPVHPVHQKIKIIGEL
jgi:hypothetical protein